jgi:hypothetical protein
MGDPFMTRAEAGPESKDEMTGSSNALQNGLWGRRDGTQEKKELGMIALLRIDTRRNG